VESLRSRGARWLRALTGAHPPDRRSGRVVAVIECIANQNARDAGAATFPSANWEVLRLCREHEVGVLQMTCPEIAFLGFRRSRQPGESIRDAIDTPEGRRCCAGIAGTVVDRIEEYVSGGYRVMAVLGGNPASPGCAVHRSGDGLMATSGVLMRELHAELRRRGIEIPFRGIRDHDPRMLMEDLEWLRRRFSEAPR
jgi:predicted secreted protein